MVEIDDIDWVALLPRVARRLLGEPSHKRGDVLGFGPIAVSTIRDAFYDAESRTTGGTLDLIVANLRVPDPRDHSFQAIVITVSRASRTRAAAIMTMRLVG
jgi:hypothetical protein